MHLFTTCLCVPCREVGGEEKGREGGGGEGGREEGEGQRGREERRGKEGEGLEIFRINSSSGLPRDRMKTKMYLREETLCVCISLSLFTHT